MNKFKVGDRVAVYAYGLGRPILSNYEKEREAIEPYLKSFEKI